MSSYAGIVTLLAGLGAFLIIIEIGIYVLVSTANFMAFRKANLPNPWLAYIPIANYWPFMRCIKKSAWNILWLLVPIVNVVMAFIWVARFFRAFGVSRRWLLSLIALIIPYIGALFVAVTFIVLYCVIGFSNKRQYNPNFDMKYTNASVMA